MLDPSALGRLSSTSGDPASRGGSCFETCNGIDDDCDGVVDDGGAALCADGVACTTEICSRSGTGCRSLGAAWDGLGCSTARCARGICNGAVPPTVNPALPRTPVDANGCQQALDSPFCEAVFDRCDCNGATACDPSIPGLDPGEARSGCRLASPASTNPQLWPCESPVVPLGASGDANLCTGEQCCEPNGTACRYVRDPTLPSVGSTMLLDPGAVLCTNSFIPRRPGGAGPSSAVPECFAWPSVMSATDRILQTCNDNDPCTLDSCANPATGACTNAPFPFTVAKDPTTISVSGRAVRLDSGCTGIVNRGCGERLCRPTGTTSTCLLGAVPGQVAGTTTALCGGTSPNPGSECFSSSCDGAGSCQTAPNDASCQDDGRWCTVEFCNARGDCEYTIAGGCLIGGACIPAFEYRSASPTECFWCDPGSPAGWSIDPARAEQCLP